MIESVQPAQKLVGNLILPPDKSISHRSALFAAISDDISTIHNYSAAADPQSTLACLKQLGVRVKRDEKTVKIHGVGRGGFKTPEKPLDCGNSGTTMRLLSGIVAGAGINCSLTGDHSLSARTMKRIIEPLKRMGCVIDGRKGEYAPLDVGTNNGIQGIRFPLPIPSAQLKSSVLLAGLFGETPTEIVEVLPSRDHTERLLDLKSEAYGTGKIIRSSKNDIIPAQNYAVPGDFSASAFWLVAGSIHPDAKISMKSVGTNPTRTGALEILRQMGAEISQKNISMAGKEPVADLSVKTSRLKGIELDPEMIPNCIDELPVLMVAMCFAEGKSVISGAEELKHKETDRLAAMGEILTLAGADVTLKDDGIMINGSPGFVPQPAQFPSYHDHRMAMAAAVLSLRGKSISKISDSECTAISYPGFWNHLVQISRDIV